MTSKILHVTFARMNPPTTAHIDLIRQMEAAGDYLVVLSTKMDEKNPIHFMYKNYILRTAIPTLSVAKNLGFASDLFDAMNFVDRRCKAKKYKKIVLWAGSDRIAAMSRVKLYPDRWSFTVEDIREIPRAADGVSATAVRAAVVNNDYDSYKNMIGAAEELQQHLYEYLQQALTNANGSLESTAKTSKRRRKRS